MKDKAHTKRGCVRSADAGDDGEGQDAELAQEPQPNGAYTEPTAAELTETADGLRRIAALLQESGGLLTPQLRHIIGHALERPHVRPASLAMLYTRFVRSERNYELEHRLCVALEVLGRLMNRGTPSDPRAGVQLRSIAEGLSPRVGPVESGTVADVPAGARPSSVPKQVSPSRSHSDTVPPDVRPPAEPAVGKRVGEPTTDLEPADATGYVARPTDSSSYVPMAAIRANYCKDMGLTTIKEITKVLEDFPTNRIRWTRPPSKKSGAPHPQRRSVRLVDWEAYVDRLKHPRAATDEVGFQDLSPVEIEASKASVRRNCKVRK